MLTHQNLPSFNNDSSGFTCIKLAIILQSTASSKGMKGFVQRGTGVDRGVVRGVATGEGIKLKVVGLITPLIAFTGLILEQVNICKKGDKSGIIIKNIKRIIIIINLQILGCDLEKKEAYLLGTARINFKSIGYIQYVNRKKMIKS